MRNKLDSIASYAKTNGESSIKLLWKNPESSLILYVYSPSKILYVRISTKWNSNVFLIYKSLKIKNAKFAKTK